MRAKHLVVAATLVLLPTAALAGEQANAPTATGETGLFTLFTGDTLPQGRGSFGLYFNNWDRLIEAGDDETEISLDWSRLSASFGYGITDAWEISVMAPYEDFDLDADDFPFDSDPDASGFGRVRVGTKFRVAGAPGDATTMAINLFVEAPTGDEDDVPDGDETGFGAGLNWRASNWVFNIGFHDSGGPAFDQEVIGGIGYAGAVSDRLDWITELAVTAQVGDAPLEDAIDLTTGGRYWFGEDGNWAFNYGLRLNVAEISDIDEHCPIGGLLGLTYFPRFFMRAEPAPEPMPEPAPVPPPPPPAPAPAPPPPPAPAPRPEIRETCVFDSGGARLTNICKAKLDEVALKMKQDPALRAEVIGYSDSLGSETSNQRISEQRAEAVKTYLVTRHGIDASRITTSGRGSADPVASNDTASGRAENRRAVVILRAM